VARRGERKGFDTHYGLLTVSQQSGFTKLMLGGEPRLCMPLSYYTGFDDRSSDT